MLNRLKTLATESASSTFTGDRSNINVEYQQLVTDITRQACQYRLERQWRAQSCRITCSSAGGNTNTNSQVNIDLSVARKTQVDSTGLGLANTSVLGGGNVNWAANLQRLDCPPGASIPGQQRVTVIRVQPDQ